MDGRVPEKPLVLEPSGRSRPDSLDVALMDREGDPHLIELRSEIDLRHLANSDPRKLHLGADLETAGVLNQDVVFDLGRQQPPTVTDQKEPAHKQDRGDKEDKSNAKVSSGILSHGAPASP